MSLFFFDIINNITLLAFQEQKEVLNDKIYICLFYMIQHARSNMVGAK